MVVLAAQGCKRQKEKKEKVGMVLQCHGHIMAEPTN
jgi:hypothetical protein